MKVKVLKHFRYGNNGKMIKKDTILNILDSACAKGLEAAGYISFITDEQPIQYENKMDSPKFFKKTIKKVGRK